MFNKKNFFEEGSADHATVTVQTISLNEEQRLKIEQDLANFEPVWERNRCKLSVPIDADTQDKIGELVRMLPNGNVWLETASGKVIMSQAGEIGYEKPSRFSSDNPGGSRDLVHDMSPD